MLPAHQPVSVETMLLAVRDTLRRGCNEDEDEELDESGRAIEFMRASSVRLTRLDSFARLCIGGEGRAWLTPSRVMALVRDALAAARDTWLEGDEEEDDEAALAEDACVEACLAKLVAAEGDAPRFKEDLAAEMAGRDQTVRGPNSRLAVVHKNERVDGRIETIVDGLRAQVTALAPGTPLTTPTVLPLALSNADLMPGRLFGDGSTYADGELRTWFENDHEGHLCYACVGKEWVVLVGVKVSSC